MIVNPSPITTAAMNAMWVSSVTLSVPDTSISNLLPLGHGSLTAYLLPYDGTHLLSTGRKAVYIPNVIIKSSTDSTFAGVVSSIVTEIERQSGKTGLRSLLVSAGDPTRPVVAIGEFERNDKGVPIRFTIPDCFALASTDSVFGGVFISAMNEIARQAGLTVS